MEEEYFNLEQVMVVCSRSFLQFFPFAPNLCCCPSTFVGSTHFFISIRWHVGQSSERWGSHDNAAAKTAAVIFYVKFLDVSEVHISGETRGRNCTCRLFWMGI